MYIELIISLLYYNVNVKTPKKAMNNMLKLHSADILFIFFPLSHDLIHYNTSGLSLTELLCYSGDICIVI